MNEKIKTIINDATAVVSLVKSLRELNDARVKFLGRNGEITNLLKLLKDVPNEEKPTMGKRLNDVRVSIETMLKEAEDKLSLIEAKERVKGETLDVTLSKKGGKAYPQGALNPLTLIKNEITDIFTGLGFSVLEGPEIEFEHYNFTALNIPKDHPSRDSSDTFYINDKLLLRTQTSATQVHTLEKGELPIRIISPGKTYRPDDDATHSPMFQQIEGLVVDEHITLADLQGLLLEFAKSFFSKDTKIRFRPSHFPFTEPSVEVDLSCPACGGTACRICKNTGWLELLGAGVVNPAVLEYSGIDSKKYTGIAFGMGVERASMVKYGIPDMRLLFENDIRILKQFK
ncbi:MAG: phenylalanine--tRNA ligase subunit alpha [Firmicutes bacterium]|nr:phenylalanine--tRNA ligase subunit alpha [Bacillota bacterium]